ncbi:MAG: Asp-tRNA(Asn)/Glu-tRNA(Gln) amidotransferase subunit GatC [Patescibacteria group bacterium]
MISRADVQHIARLARLALTEEEEEKFEKELSSILGFVEKLNEADTKGVMPMTGGTMLEHVMRDDAVPDSALEGCHEQLFSAVPEKKDRWVKVKKVFEGA